ncbi:alpha/beta fold hydrolase [Aeromonas veronii]|uniref:alpha/beta fold hydrolase n=1 Tax=Aeromonas veronii TaxID=654 RepID=UPI0024421032|nr:alpha/beta fold hydrolase [Aeromonas veronii]
MVRSLAHRAPPSFASTPQGGLGWCYAPLVPHLPADMAVYALQARALCQPDAPLPASFDELALDYVTELRRQQSEGPYWLLGWSLGGMLVHRMAAMLQEQGQEVAMVLLLDAYPCQQWQTQPLPDEQRMLDALLRMGGDCGCGRGARFPYSGRRGGPTGGRGECTGHARRAGCERHD